tara:strand:- start:1457 stop:1732 length:276 start_codon:yes stop_codon:yes gene_type:complete
MGRVTDRYGRDKVPDGTMLDNLKDWMSKETSEFYTNPRDDILEPKGRKQLAEEVLKFLELRYPSFLPHRRVEDTYEAVQEYLDPFRYPNDT